MKAGKQHSGPLSGFTLVELLVTLGIAVTMIGTVIAAVSGGIRVWETAREVGQLEVNAALALEQLELDLRNTPPFYAFPLRGTAEELEAVRFPRFADSADAAPEAFSLQLYRYRYERETGRLLRFISLWPEAQSDAVESEIIIEGLEDFEFRYRAAPGNAEEGGAGDMWLTGWTDKTNAPFSVEVVLYRGEQGNPVRRRVLLPLSRDL